MELKSFRKYLSEAKVSQANVEKAISLYVKLLQKHLGIKFYRFGGIKGLVPINKGVCYLYLGSNKSAYGFNYVAGEIKSITIWRRFILYEKGDYTIELGGMGLFQAGKKLIGLLKKPKPGNYYIVPDPTINEDVDTNHGTLLGEAKMKRVSPIEFLSVMQKNLPAGQDITRMYWDDISDVAMLYGIQVPGAVRKLGSGGKRGRGGKKPTYDLTQLSNPNIVSPTDKKVEPTLFIKVTAQDPETKRFVSSANSKAAQDMYKKIETAIDKPNVNELARDVNSLFHIMKRLVQIVIKKLSNGLIVYGIGGVGKTYTVITTLQEEGLSKQKDWIKINTSVTTAELYKIFFMNRSDKILVFDDADGFWKDDDATNMLKAALDTYPVRTISWYSARTKNLSNYDDDAKQAYYKEVDLALKAGDDKIKYPSSFDFNSRIIFISNMPRENFDSAVLTRVKSIDMTLTDEEIFTRIEGILESLGRKEVPLETKKIILGHLKKKYDSKELRKAMNLRVFVSAEDMYLSGFPEWLELVNY